MCVSTRNSARPAAHGARHRPSADAGRGQDLGRLGGGNLRTLLGDGARFEPMEIVSSFADLRGHNIGVTALDGARAGLAD